MGVEEKSGMHFWKVAKSLYYYLLSVLRGVFDKDDQIVLMSFKNKILFKDLFIPFQMSKPKNQGFDISFN